MIDVHYIHTNDDLDFLIDNLQDAKELAVDLEFDNNLHHYGFNICLLQLAANNVVYIVDPLKIDISPIFPFFENSDLPKLVFSFGEDLRLLHSLGCNPKNIYDISIAAKLLNYEKISLGDVVHEQLGFKMEKGEQMSNWCNRPLTSTQMNYAAGDVIYLGKLKEILHNQSIEKGISTWIEEENLSMEGNFIANGVDNNIPTKHRRNLNEVQWHFYKGLWEYREEIAKQFDKPAHQVINNNFLVELAENPNLINQWTSLKFIHRKLKTTFYMNELIKLRTSLLNEAVELKLSSEQSALPKLSKEEVLRIKARKKRIDLLKENYFKPVQELIRRDYGDFAMTFILSNRIMEDIATNDRTTWRKYRMDLIRKYLKELNLVIPDMVV